MAQALTHFSQRDGVILSTPMGAGGHGPGLCSLPAAPSGLGTALPPPETPLAHPPTPPWVRGQRGTLRQDESVVGIVKAVGTGGCGSGCGKKAVLALLSFLTWTSKTLWNLTTTNFKKKIKNPDFSSPAAMLEERMELDHSGCYCHGAAALAECHPWHPCLGEWAVGSAMDQLLLPVLS